MITHSNYLIEPWSLREHGLNLEVLPQSESLFALSNGHVGWRGNLDEGEPHGLPGSYLNGVHELHPLPYAEAGYGYPESGQTVINITNGKIFRLLVDDEPFDIRYGTVRSHERHLDFKEGVLHRTVDWVSPTGRRVRVRSTRLVSFTQRAVGAIRYEVEAVDGDVRVVVQSKLMANEQLPETVGDPRTAAGLESPLVAEEHFAEHTRLRLVHNTAHSALRLGVAADHIIAGPESTQITSESTDHVGSVTVTSHLKSGEKLTVEKFVAHGWSSVRSLSGVRDQVDAALAQACNAGWDGLAAEQRMYLDDFWTKADVEVDGDERIQQAVRFALFHVLQAGARAEERAIPAKGLTGSGYDGHSFWDSETFVLPTLTYTAPKAVKQALRWRHSTLSAAKERASQLGLEGAAFPWRTIEGSECSAYWPAGTAAFHVNADISDAAVRYVSATGDERFEQETALELLVETARLWRSLGHHDHHGVFHIEGVTGPDEYSAVQDDNVYTNLMAQANLRNAADYVERHPRHAAALGVDYEETAAWRDAADSINVPYNEELGVHEQHRGFTGHRVWDFANTRPDQYPLLLHFPYFDLYRKQVVKQADLVLAMFMHGEAFNADQKARNFAYYEPLTVRDSSLSACIQAVIAAEVGHLRLAYDYTVEAALLDLEDRENNTRDGVHIASLAGTWLALVSGFGGMRHRGDNLEFNPKLPEHLSRLAFRMHIFRRRLGVEIKASSATYTLLEGEPLTFRHCGGEITVFVNQPVERKIQTPSTLPGPMQPNGRTPHHNGGSNPSR
jgi:alpha,alpha-trehalose phosphorylase